MIIGVVGPIASGKSVLVEYLIDKGFINLRVSDEIKEIATKRGIAHERGPLQNLGNELREKYGPGFLAERVMEKIKPGKNYVIDSIRNPGEIEIFRNMDEFIVIGVDSPPEDRLRRIVSRNKSGDPKTIEEIKDMDARDRGAGEKSSGQQVGACYDMSDYQLMNDGTMEALAEKISQLMANLDVLD